MRSHAAFLVLATSALLSCQVRGAQVGPSPFLRLFERTSGQICYVSPDGNIRVTDPAGSRDRALTDDARMGDNGSILYLNPTWSPDARMIAYTRFILGATDHIGEVSLYTSESNGTNRIRLLSSPSLRPFYLYWSPDSRRVSTLSQVVGDTDLELGISDASTAGAYERIDRGAPYYWRWLSDSSAIAAHVNARRGPPDGERLSVITVGSIPDRTDLPVDANLFQAPDLAPDGKTLGYVTRTASGFSLRLRRLDNSSEREIASGTGDVYFAFSRDSRHVAYLSAPNTIPIPQGALTVVSLSGKAVSRKLADGPVLAFFWAPDGKKLAFLVPDPGESMDKIFQSGEGVLPLKIVGCDPDTGRTWTIARFPGSRGLISILPFFDQYLRSSTLWSPDSRSLVFTATSADGEPGVYVARADGNVKPRFLVAGDFAFWSWK